MRTTPRNPPVVGPQVCSESFWGDDSERATASKGEPTSDDQFTGELREVLPILGRFIASRAPELDRDDVVQDTVARAWQKRRSFEPGRSNLRTWLIAIAADQIRQHRRRQWRSVAQWKVLGLLDDGARDAPTSTPQDDDLMWAIRRLPAKQQESILLRYYVGLSVTEIAEFQNVVPGTVKSSLSDGRKNLKKILEGQHHDR